MRHQWRGRISIHLHSCSLFAQIQRIVRNSIRILKFEKKNLLLSIDLIHVHSIYIALTFKAFIDVSVGYSVCRNEILLLFQILKSVSISLFIWLLCPDYSKIIFKQQSDGKKCYPAPFD